MASDGPPDSSRLGLLRSVRTYDAQVGGFLALGNLFLGNEEDGIGSFRDLAVRAQALCQPSNFFQVCDTEVLPNAFTVEVTDMNGCQTTASADITEPALLTASATGMALACNGDTNGSIDPASNWHHLSKPFFGAPSPLTVLQDPY